MSTATDSLFGFCVLVGLFSYTYSMIETEELSKHCSSIDINHVCTFSRILRLKDRLLSATMKLSNHLLYKRNSALRFAYMSIITTGWVSLFCMSPKRSLFSNSDTHPWKSHSAIPRLNNAKDCLYYNHCA